MGHFSELHAEGPYRTCGEADEARRFYPEEYRIATTSGVTAVPAKTITKAAANRAIKAAADAIGAADYTDVPLSPERTKAAQILQGASVHLSAARERVRCNDPAGAMVRAERIHQLVRQATDLLWPAKEETAVGHPIAPAYTKRIGEYDPDTDHYPAYVAIDGAAEQLVGWGRTAGAADVLADEHAYNYYIDTNTPETAAQIAIAMSEAEPSRSEGEPIGRMRWNEHDQEFRIDPSIPAYECERCGKSGVVLHSTGGAWLCNTCDPDPAGLAWFGCPGVRVHTPIEPPPVDPAPFRCCCCGATEHAPSAMQPAACCECVRAWLLGFDSCASPGYRAMPPDDPFAAEPPPPATVEKAVELAYAMRHVPLPDEARYGHRAEPTRPGPKALIAAGACPVCLGSHHPQQCQWINALLMRDKHVPNHLSSIRAAYASALADNYPIFAEALVAHAMCEAERYVRGA